MTDTAAILTQARQLAQQLPYAGAVTPSQAYALLQADPSIQLIDVRTRAERDWVGRVDIATAQHQAIEWNLYPQGTENPDFLQQLAQIAKQQQVLLFLCRSGVRSRHAAQAATAAGYLHCFDILQGFEGNKDASGHRKSIEGWCYAELPWIGA